MRKPRYLRAEVKDRREWEKCAQTWDAVIKTMEGQVQFIKDRIQCDFSVNPIIGDPFRFGGTIRHITVDEHGVIVVKEIPPSEFYRQ